MKNKNSIALAISLIIPQLAGGVGSLATAPNIGSWYEAIVKPSFNPPNFIFGPVWITLFALMGIALYLVWKHGTGEGRRIALTFFGIQLGLNVAWSFLFFAAHSPGLAFAEIIALWLAILATAVSFWRVRRTAAWLLAPYLAWVSFAALLNFSIWQLN